MVIFSYFTIQSSISIKQHHKFLSYSRKYYRKSAHQLRKEEPEQTADYFSEQTLSCTAEGEPGKEKKIFPMKLEKIVRQEDAMAKEFCGENSSK